MEKEGIRTIGYGEFLERLSRNSGGLRVPFSGSCEVTARCNLQCRHCYINLPLDDRTARTRELTSREWITVVDSVTDEGCLWLLLTGGEPFIRPDFLKIYSHAKKRGLLVTIFSNGTTITPRIADFLAEQPPFAVEITLYGCTEKTYESVTRVPGSFGRCMKGIELLVERDLPLSLKSVALTLNQHELEAMGTYAGGLGLEFRFDPELNMRIDGGKRPALFRLTPEQVVALDIRDRRRRNEWEKSCRDTRRVNGSSDLLYPCGAGVHSFHIDPYGELSICMMVRSATYNLRKGKFVEGWHRFIPEVRSTRRTKKIPCDTCNLTSICSQCPGVAEMETGDPEQVVEYLCRITRLRERVFGSYYTTGERKDDNCSSGLLAKEALQEA